MLGTNLGASELKVSDLEDELKSLNKKYEDDMAELQKSHDEVEKVASKVPGLEEKVEGLEAKLLAMTEAEARAQAEVDRWQAAHADVVREMAKNKVRRG
jgi:chromosome segregation ATPase